MSPPGSQYHVAEQVLGEPLLYISAREHGSIRSLLVFCIHAMLSPVFWIHGQPAISADGFTLALESVCRSLFSTTIDSFAARLIHSSWVAVMEMVWPTRWENTFYHCFAESNQSTARGYFLETRSMPPLKTQKIKETYTAQEVNEVRFTRHCFQGYTHSY